MISDELGEQTLYHCHADTPQRDAEERAAEPRQQGKRQVGRNHCKQPPSEQPPRRNSSRPAAAAGASSTPNRTQTTASTAWITAIQNTIRISVAKIAIRLIASNGPAKAPRVLSDPRNPNARPRIPGGVMSATSASRGAPRNPLPIRSANRAPNQRRRSR